MRARSCLNELRGHSEQFLGSPDRPPPHTPTQSEGETLPAADAVPCAHGLHALLLAAPEVLECVSAGHLVQSTARALPVASRKRPGPQASHRVDAAAGA